MSLSMRRGGLRAVLVERDEEVFILAMALTLVHVIGEALFGHEDQSRRGFLLTAVAISLVVLYHRLGPTGRARTALVVGAVGFFAVVVVHIAEAMHHGLELGVYLAGFAVVGNVILVVLGWTLAASNRQVRAA